MQNTIKHENIVTLFDKGISQILTFRYTFICCNCHSKTFNTTEENPVMKANHAIPMNKVSKVSCFF